MDSNEQKQYILSIVQKYSDQIIAKYGFSCFSKNILDYFTHKNIPVLDEISMLYDQLVINDPNIFSRHENMTDEEYAEKCYKILSNAYTDYTINKTMNIGDRIQKNCQSNLKTINEVTQMMEQTLTALHQSMKAEILVLMEKYGYEILPEFDKVYDRIVKENGKAFLRRCDKIYSEIDNSKIFHHSINEVIEYLQSLSTEQKEMAFDYDSEEDYLMLCKNNFEDDEKYVNRCYIILKNESAHLKTVQNYIKKKTEIISKLQSQLDNMLMRDGDEEVINRIKKNLYIAEQELKQYKHEHNI